MPPRTPEEAPTFQEESWALPSPVVQEIMQDETCVALPPLKPLTAPASPQYMVSLRNLHSQQEYTHPKPITSLQHYNLYFINCYLLADVNLLAEQTPFPILTPPGANGAGPVTVALMQLQGRDFRVTVVQAPPPDANLALMARSPPLPSGLQQFHDSCLTSPERKACLRHFAASALARGLGLSVERRNAGPGGAVPPDDSELADLMLSAQLVHGAGAQQALGARYDIVSGGCVMHELERSAASVSLPLVLRYLYFLQFSLQDEQEAVSYHILAPTKTSYMVHIRGLGGWEAYYLVNMHATWEACQAAFLTSRKKEAQLVPAVGQFHSPEAFVTSLLQRMHVMGSTADRTELLRDTFMVHIMTQLQALQAVLEALPAAETETPEVFYAKMQQRGLQAVQRELLDKKSVYSNYVDMERARPLLGYLTLHAKSLSGRGRSQPPVPPPSTTLSVDRILAIALEAFTYCVMDVWYKQGNQSSTQQAVEFMKLLNATRRAYVTIDHDLLPILMQTCAASPCSGWWEHTLKHLTPRGDAKHIKAAGGCLSLLLCNTLLYHAEHFTSLFPERLFPADVAKDLPSWAGLIDEVCESHPKQNLGVAKANYERLCGADSNCFNAYKFTQQRIQRRFHYCRAVALGMLYGRSKPNYIQAMHSY
jgi:hypothetical protein